MKNNIKKQRKNIKYMIKYSKVVYEIKNGSDEMKTEVTIIGGGASGMMAAIEVAKSGKDVIVIDRKDRVLKKVLVTGNGRCNLTNVNAKINNYFSTGSDIKKIENILNDFQPKDTMNFFESLGVVCNEEARGKVFPLSGQAGSVIDALRFEAERVGVKFALDFYVKKIEKKGFQFIIYSEDKRIITSNRVLLASGGQSYPELGSNGSGFELAREFGHTITPLFPSIVQFKTEEYQVKGLKGIKLDTKVTAYGDNKEICTYDGELLFTDYGVSGNVIFNISFVFPIYKKVELEVDFMPKFSYNELLEKLKERKEILGYLTMEHFFNGMINKKLGQFLSKASGIEKLSKKIKNLTDNDLIKLCDTLKKYRLNVIDTTGYKNAQVTAGGVALDEVNMETLESKKVKGLYFSGEILDVYGECGGFNFQWAWASGKKAGENISK